MSFIALALPILSLSCWGQGVSEQLYGCLAAGWGQPTTKNKLQ